MNILLLSRWFPYPPNNGSKIRIFNIIRELSLEHQVSLVTFYEPSDDVNEQTLSRLQSVCRVVHTVAYRRFQPSSARAIIGLLSPQPRSFVDTHSAEMRAAVEEQRDKWRCDLVVASELSMVPYALALSGTSAIVEDLELSVFLDATYQSGSALRRARALLTWTKLCAYLRDVLPRFAACTVVSEREKANVLNLVPGYPGVSVIPNAVDLNAYSGNFGVAKPNTLIFAGALTYDANYDAILNFLAETYPLIRRKIPDITLRITGDTAGVNLASLPQHPGVQFTGNVPDIRPLVAQSWASIVPLRIGGGTRLKILESMALGTPVVSTAKGAEGLDVAGGHHLLIADQPTAFATAVVELLRSPRLRDRLAQSGRSLVAQKYSWDSVGKMLRSNVLRAVGSGSAR